MRILAALVGVLALTQLAHADQEVPVNNWGGTSPFVCEVPAQHGMYGFHVDRPRVVLKNCDDSTGLCLSFSSNISFYRCQEIGQIKSGTIRRKSKDGMMAIVQMPFDAYANDRFQLGGPYETGTYTEWLYLPLSEIMPSPAKANLMTSPTFDLGLSDVLAVNRKSQKDVKGILNLQFRWHWSTHCTNDLNSLPCPEISAGRGTRFYQSPGYYLMDMTLDLGEATPMDKAAKVKKFQFRQ